jgi:hypothetical protein
VAWRCRDLQLGRLPFRGVGDRHGPSSTLDLFQRFGEIQSTSHACRRDRVAEANDIAVVVGVVLARYTPSGDKRNEVRYIVQLESDMESQQ